MQYIIQYILKETKDMHSDNLSYIKAIVAKAMGSQVGIKSLGSIILAVYGFGFDVLKNEVLLALVALTVLDFITGVIAARMNGESIKSTKILRTAIKLFVYMLMVSGAHLCETIVPVTKAFLDETILGFLALTELISLLENAGKMGFVIPQKLLNQLEKLRGDEQPAGIAAAKK